MGPPLIWLRSTLVTTALVVRQAVLSFRSNWGVALLSVALAVSLWVFVTEREDPDRTGLVPGTVPIEVDNLPPDRALFPPLEESVTIRVRAPESEFEELTAEDFRAAVDLSEAIGDQATVNVLVKALKPGVAVLGFSPATVSVSLESVVSEMVPVLVDADELGGLPPGYQLGPVSVDVQEAEVTGRADLVADIQSVRPNLDLTGTRLDFEQRVELQAVGELGGLIQGVEIDPQTAVVSVEIIQTEFTFGFIVNPVVRGVPAAGHRVTSIEWEPVAVDVTGSTEVLQSIDAVQGIETEALSIGGATADVVGTRALRLPQGARVDQPIITIRVSIERVASETEASSPILRRLSLLQR